jgi:hypothetical protein
MKISDIQFFQINIELYYYSYITINFFTSLIVNIYSYPVFISIFDHLYTLLTPLSTIYLSFSNISIIYYFTFLIPCSNCVEFTIYFIISFVNITFYNLNYFFIAGITLLSNIYIFSLQS